MPVSLISTAEVNFNFSPNSSLYILSKLFQALQYKPQSIFYLSISPRNKTQLDLYLFIYSESL